MGRLERAQSAARDWSQFSGCGALALLARAAMMGALFGLSAGCDSDLIALKEERGRTPHVYVEPLDRNLPSVLRAVRGEPIEIRVRAMDELGNRLPVVADLSELPAENSGTLQITRGGIGIFRWTPRLEDRGGYWVRFVASVGDVRGEWACFILTALPGPNVAPVVTAPDTVVMAVGDTVTFHASAADGNDEAITGWSAHVPDSLGLTWYRDIVVGVEPMFPVLDSVATVQLWTSRLREIPLTVRAHNSLAGAKRIIVRVTP